MSASCHGPGSPDAAGPSLAGPRTPGDTGDDDPRLAAALGRWSTEGGAGTEAGVYAALPAARVFVPVVATLDEAETDAATGRAAEKSSSMSVVTLVGRSGATALPAFLSTAAMRRWRLDARPVPVTGREACLAALDGGHAAVVVDPAGARFAVEGPALAALADGWVPSAGAGGSGRLASRRVGEDLRLGPAARPLPEPSRVALVDALAAEPDLAEAYEVDAAVGDEAPVWTLGLVLGRDVAPEALGPLAARLQSALARIPGTGDVALAVLNGRQRDELAGAAEPLWSVRTAGPVRARRPWWRRGG